MSFTTNPAPLTARQALHDDIYEGIFIPKDTIIHYPTLVVNTHPLFWGPDAEEFRPERWDDLKDFPNTNFLTFQHGLSQSIPTNSRSSFMHWSEIRGNGNESHPSGPRRLPHIQKGPRMGSRTI